MSIKIYLSPSNQTANAYAAGGTTEAQQCYRIAEAAKAELERQGFSVRMAPYNQSMSKSIAESNAFGADLHICIHTNAGGGQGTLVMVYRQADQNLRYARPIYEALCAVTLNGYGYGIREYPQLAELNATAATAVYCECEFHDRSDLAEWIIGHTDVLGRAIAQGVCEGAGLTQPPQDGQQENSPGLYRVRRDWADAASQKGAFAVYENAVCCLEQNPGYAIFDASGKLVRFHPSETEGDKPEQEGLGPNPEIVWDYAYEEPIAELQRVLQEKGWRLAVDGKAGADTYRACRSYTIEEGDSGPLTRWVQSRLNSLGFPCGAADGIAGPNTMGGIAAFQKRYGLGVGYLGGTDWYYLIR